MTTLEERVAELLGTQAAVFFPTGTMAQQVALRYGADRSGRPTVALHPLGHLEVHERHAYAQLSGLRGTWPTTEPRNPTADEITALAEPVSTVVIELPLRDAGFVLPSWDELVAVAAAARSAGARVHFDGARIWESTPYLGHSLREVAGLADSVYVSFYKTIGGISGAALAGTEQLRRVRPRLAAPLRRHGVPAVAGRADRARRPGPGAAAASPTTCGTREPVAAALAALPGARVFPAPPHTQRFRLWLPNPAEALNDAALALAEQEKVWFAAGWRDTDVPGMAMTEITVAAPALDWTADDITEVGNRFLAKAADH